MNFRDVPGMCPHPPQRTGVATAEGKNRLQTHGVDSVFLRGHFSSKIFPSTNQRPKDPVDYWRQRIRVGQSRSMTGPCSTELDRSLTPEGRSRTERIRLGAGAPHMENLHLHRRRT